MGRLDPRSAKRFVVGAEIGPRMARGEELARTAAALDGSVVVCGTGAYADALASRRFPGAWVTTVDNVLGGTPGSNSDSADPDPPNSDPDPADPDPSNSDPADLGSLDPDPADPPAVAAVVVAVDPDRASESREPLQALAATGAFVVAVVPSGAVDPESLAALSRAVDGVLLAGSADAADAVDTADSDPVSHVGDAIHAFLAAVQEPGFVNLDLTDARTVLSSGVAAVGVGTAARDTPESAVAAAFDRLPTGVDPTAASAVLVDVVVDPDTSITAATDVIGRVRDRIGADANVIWGGAVDESANAELLVRVVVADVRYDPPLAAGDPCPRCGASLSAYTFGASETLSCDACGYSGIGMR